MLSESEFLTAVVLYYLCFYLFNLINILMPNDCCTSCCIGDCECITIQPVQYSLFRQICASSMGSIISTVALNPVTVIKVRLQNLHANNSYVSESILHKASGVSPIRGVINTVLKERGVAGFWAGTRTGIAMSVPNTVLYMSIYEHFKISFAEDTRLASVRAVTPALAGALARLVSVTIISPLEMLRTIQTGGSGDPIRAIARSIVREDGIKGLYRGIYCMYVGIPASLCCCTVLYNTTLMLIISMLYLFSSVHRMGVFCAAGLPFQRHLLVRLRGAAPHLL